jgi:hypothetical protein
VRVLRYLKQTKDICFTYKRACDNTPPSLCCYADASWAPSPDTRRSVSGYAILFSGASIQWRSHLQSVVALSSTEAEYISAAEAAREIVTLRRFLSELGYIPHSPTPIFVDNTACVQLAKDWDAHHRTKHVDIRYHFIRQAVDEKALTVHHVPRTEQPADIMTKSASKLELTAFRHVLLGK